MKWPLMTKVLLHIAGHSFKVRHEDSKKLLRETRRKAFTLDVIACTGLGEFGTQ
jgi:hypothetical protein